MTSTTKYTFDEAAPRGKDEHDNASLTYSAASSINSTAGESTDSSSFADIMRVLDGDEKELANYLRGAAGMPRKDEKSIAADSLAYSTNADSLAYSTDMDSHMRSLQTTDDKSGLYGTDLLSTIAGQPSDQAYDHGGGASNDAPPEDGDILFSPAEHTDGIKRRKERKRRERWQEKLRKKQQQQENATPRVKNSSKDSSQHARPPRTSATAPVELQEDDEEEDVWYAKWWMFCFPDAIKNLSPKR